MVAEAEGNLQSFAQKTIDESNLLIPSKVQADDLPPERPSGPEVAEVARKLGIDMVFDSDLLYIAEDLLVAALPEHWEAHRDDTGKAYYHNTATETTQWAHPLEQYYRGLVFMRKEGDQLLEDKALQNPPTPEETREMAKYFGIETREEVYLVPIAKAAVNAPLPPEWEEYEDDDGEVYFVSKITKKTSEHHPLDGYFIELINQKRIELHGMQPPAYPISEFHLLDYSFVPYPWMEFVDLKTLQPYWYNFKDNIATYNHPCDLVKDVLRNNAVLKLQAWYRGYTVRKINRQLVEHLAATSIQKIFRGHHQRGEFDVLKGRRQEEAATMIQSIWRGSRQRQEDVDLKVHSAAKMIQARWRGTLSRRNQPLKTVKVQALPFGFQRHLGSQKRQLQLEHTTLPTVGLDAMNTMLVKLERAEETLENIDKLKIIQQQVFVEDTDDPVALPTTPANKKAKKGKKGKK